MSLIQITGSRFTRDGSEVRLRGLNLGNWMLIEHYMIGLPWTEYKMREAFLDILGPDRYRAFFDTFMDASLTDADFAFMERCGFNFVRLPLNYRWFGDAATGRGGADTDRTCRAFDASAHDGFALVDRCLDLARAHGISVMLDLHAAPGVQVRDWNAESAYGEAFLWDHEHFIDRCADLWRALAARYRDDETVFGYDILGEPLCPDHDLLHRFNMRMIGAIRSVDPHHVIVVEGDRWGQDAASLRDELFADPQLTYSPHFYPTAKLPFDRLTEYPGEWEGRRYGRDELVALLEGYTDEARIERPVLMGEFGVSVPMRVDGGTALIGQGVVGGSGRAAARQAMLRDVVGHIEEKGWSWAMWDYKDLGMLGLVVPKPDTPWRRFVGSPEARRWREGYSAAMADLTKSLAAAYPDLDERTLFLLRFGANHHWDATILPKVVALLQDRSAADLQEMAESFRLDNCEVNEAKVEVLAGSLGGQG